MADEELAVVAAEFQRRAVHVVNGCFLALALPEWRGVGYDLALDVPSIIELGIPEFRGQCGLARPRALAG